MLSFSQHLRRVELKGLMGVVASVQGGGGDVGRTPPATRHPCLWRRVWGCGWTLRSWSCPSCRWAPRGTARPPPRPWSGLPWWSAAPSGGPRGSHLGCRRSIRTELKWPGVHLPTAPATHRSPPRRSRRRRCGWRPRDRCHWASLQTWWETWWSWWAPGPLPSSPRGTHQKGSYLRREHSFALKLILMHEWTNRNMQNL